MSEEIKISEMLQADNMNDDDIIMIVQKNANKKITKANLLKEINEKITKLLTYSTEETNTGKKWIDGKDIYRKVFIATKTTEDLSISIRLHCRLCSGN